MFSKIVNKIKSDNLLKGSMILFIMINIFNVINYIFQFSMVRLLGPEDYGIFAVLMSFVYIFSIFVESIQTVISKYTSKFNVEGHKGKIKRLIFKSIKKSLYVAFFIFLLLIPVSFLLSYILKINVSFIIFTNLLLFAIVSQPILRGVLQGTKNFKQLGWNMIIEASLKLIISISLVLIGFRVYGPITGVILGALISFFIIFLNIKDIIKSKEEEESFDNIYSFSLPVIISMIAIVLMYSVDIIIAKAIFNPELAGKYAVVSMFGKIIFFGTYAIGKAMFPFSTESHESGKNAFGIFKKSLIMASLFIIVCLFAYLITPSLIIRTLAGSKYLDISGLLFIVGLAFSFVSLSNLFVLYLLSINKLNKSYWSLLLLSIIQIISLIVFGKDIFSFSITLLIVNLMLLIYSGYLIFRESKLKFESIF
jgi:O-antigen/teichoic acid export membrane protein